MPQKVIPAATLELLRDLLSSNEYDLPEKEDLENDDPNLQPDTLLDHFEDDDLLPSVLDLVLHELIWTNGIADVGTSIESNSPEAAEQIRRIGDWRVPCRVREAAVGDGGSITVGAYNGPGATVQSPEPDRPGNVWVAVVTETMPSTVPHTEVDLSSGPPAAYPNVSRWVLTDRTGGGRSDVYDALAGADSADTVAMVDLFPFPASEFDLGPFPDGATVYVGFPRAGVLDYPDWFLDDFTEAGEQIIVDRALKIGGGVGGVSAHLESGGAQSRVDLPTFVEPFLGDRRIRFDVPSAIEVGPFGITMIANIDSLSWDPASSDGTLGLAFEEKDGMPSVAFTLETSPDADMEIHVIDGPDLDIEELDVTLFLAMDVREERLYWVPKASAHVSLEASLDPGGDVQEIEASVASQIESTVTGELPPHLVQLVGSWLGALPVLRHDRDGERTFTKDLVDEDRPLFLANDLLRPNDDTGSTEVHGPEYPTSFLPSSLRQAVLSDPQRMLDRFVRYLDARVEPDPDGSGNRLVVDYEFFPEHEARSEDQSYTHEAIPRETFALKPLALRPSGREKWGVEWGAYSAGSLLELVEDVRPAFPYWWPAKYLPKLTLEYEVRVDHDALPGPSRIWHEERTYPLAELTPQDEPRYFFSDTELTPAGFAEHLHHLEMPSLLNEASGDVLHEATFTIEGSATLEYWQEKNAPSGCAAVLLAILRRWRARQDVEEAQAEAQSGGISEEPTEPEVLEAEVRDRYERVEVSLGTFSGPAPSGFVMGDDSGLAPDTGVGNELTVAGAFAEVDFLLERHSVDPDAYDWIQAAFRNFSLHVDEKRDLEQSTSPVDALRDGRPFDVVARLQGEEIATARYRLERGTTAAGTIVSVGRPTVFEGERWKRQLYFPTDNTGFSVTASLEVRRQGQVLAEVNTSWTRTEEGAAWSDRAEWGIPTGHPSVVRTLVSDDDRLRVNVELRNQLHDPAAVPLEHRPKKLAVSFDQVEVLDDKDPFAAGELEYWVDVERKQPGEDGFVRVGSRRRSRVMELSTGDTTDPDLADVEASFKPEDDLRVVADGREIDNPRWFDPHDPLDRARSTRTVTFDDQQDGPMQLDSPDFVMDTDVRTVSRPIAPQLQIWNGAGWGGSWETDEEDPTVTLRVYGSWANVLELRTFEGARGDREERPDSVDALPVPKPTGQYGSLPATVSLTPPDDPNADPEDFVYYVTLSPSLSADQALSYQIVAKNAAGYAASEGYVFVSVV